MRYFFHIAYNGIAYRGWQRQPNVKSVQEVIETVLERMLKEKIICYGCGRTDAMVHADQYIFHINTSREIDDSFVFIFNKNLPADISCFEICKTEENRHARYDVIERRYDYYIHFASDPFLNPISTLYTKTKLDTDKMLQAVRIIGRASDFETYCLTPEKHNHTRCKIADTRLMTDDTGQRMRFSITADRFLKSMIRLLAGALLEVGAGEMLVDEFAEALLLKKCRKNRTVAHPQGLHLSRVVYPYKTFAQDSYIARTDNRWLHINSNIT